ncbi:hypothetical protein SLA2020_271080 [Shorea laevis]
MSEDFKKLKGLVMNVRTKVLQGNASTLESMGRDINSYHLVVYNIIFDEAEIRSREINEELEILVSAEDLLAVESLNTQQKYAYETILHKVIQMHLQHSSLTDQVEQEIPSYIEQFLLQ